MPDPIEIAPTHLTAALGYASRGWRVFPIYSVRDGVCSCGRDTCTGKNRGKHPITPDGFKSASCDQATIRRWWATHPNANVGIATGLSGLCVIDVDGDDGAAALAALESEHGPLPECPTVITGSGGAHYYFRRPDGDECRSSAGQVADRIDVRCDGGYVVAAPSSHYSGGAYAWDAGADLEDVPVPALPDWLARKVLAAKRAKLDHTPTGSWDDGVVGRAFRHAGMVIRAIDDVRAAVQCPFTDHEPGGETSTVVFAPTVDNPDGRWHCSHATCNSRTNDDAMAELPPGALRRARADLAPVVDTDDDDAPDWTMSLVWRSTRTGRQLEAVPGNAVLYLTRHPEWMGRLRYDTYVDRARWGQPPPKIPGLVTPTAGDLLSDHHYPYIHHWFASRPTDHERANFGTQNLRDAVEAAAREDEYSSLAEWLRSLTWDGTPRVHQWLVTYMNAVDTPVTRSCGRWWLISAVARAMHPGCQVDHVLVLEGGQGAGKSSCASILAGDHYLSTMGSLRDEVRAAATLRGKWVVEIGELDAIKGARATQVKDFLTRRTDTFRAAYKHHECTFLRQCVFLATTNDVEYLQDPTGARRFWPVSVGTLDRDALVRDREQLWAEAVHMYTQGTQWWPSSDIEDMLSDEQENRREQDPWESTIKSWLDQTVNLQKAEAQVTVEDGLSQVGIEPSKMDRRAASRMSAIYRTLHMKRIRPRVNGVLTRMWQYKSKEPM